ncbi:MAG: M36 family metallopeptidase [Saprospiraceae bacterium]|nr:M36 family metallopeptidase [Saprospiraceae bacterium]
MKIIMYKLLVVILLCITHISNAQIQSPIDAGLRFLETHATSIGLSREDIKDLAVTDLYRSEHNGITHVYFIQRYKGIEIYNAITSVHISKEGKIYDSPSRFYRDLAKNITATKPRISERDALIGIVKHLDIQNALIPSNILRHGDSGLEFPKTNFTHSSIPVKLVYMPLENGSIRLAWDMSLDLTTSNDYWSVRIDAITGEVLDKHNLVVKCSFKHKHHKQCIPDPAVFQKKPVPVKDLLENIHNSTKLLTSAPDSYHVVALPDESPRHGPRQYVVNPADSKASPFGWHDTNGIAGPEYLITRGNNVHAYLDRNGDNLSDGGEPNGGNDLIFDFPFDQSGEPDQYKEAATVNLFYLNNMMHDISYNFGFTEVAGNFQTNNYGKGGREGDAVRAEAQDGSGTDNANFSTPNDGNGGRMQMFLWLASQEETYITKPDSFAGAVDCRRGGFGPAPGATPIEADVVIGNDYSANPTLGCVNGFKRADVEGKIVLIDRGTCEFGAKSLNAQRAGAAGVIICNGEDGFVNMGAGAVGGQVTIPAYFTTRTICQRLKMMVTNGGLRIQIKRPDTNAGPDSLDGDFDNGIIAHEYGHGISNRLTGGPSSSNCLGNGEQMGEGWSDFMSLIVTAKPGDQGSMPKGIGTYALNEKPDGFGIRRRLYTNDMTINEFTYKNVDPEVHNLGEVWTTVIWDLYWALADKYGYDPDWKNKNAGNNIAIQLVFDGMKLQPCSPGFIDGRNAILRADTINNQAKNACLIWDVFARRGMGFFAKQGSNNMVGDETLSFLSAPICIDKILLTKRAGYYSTPDNFVQNDVVKPGTEFYVTLEINNYQPEIINNVTIKDLIPTGCSYVPGSANIAPSASGSELVWNLGQMKSLETRRITYKLSTSISIASTTNWYDDVELGEDNWEIDLSKGDQIWYRDEGYGVDQSFSWIAEEKENGSDDFVLYLREPLKMQGNEPSMLFYHFFNTETGFDGGIVEVSTDGFVWNQIAPQKFSLNSYTGPVNYQTFVTFNVEAFSGQSNGFIPSVVDFSDFKDQEIQVRFRFANDSLNVSSNTSTILGWVVDNIEFINPKFYNSEVCLTTNEGDLICTTFPGKGVLADSDKIVETNAESKPAAVNVYPNPSGNYLILRLGENSDFDELQFLNLNGQLLKTVSIETASQLSKVDVQDLPKGMVMLRFSGKSGSMMKKLLLK